MGQYVTIESPDIANFVKQLKGAKDDFRKELLLFLEALGLEFLRVVEDEIIRKQTVDTRLLLNSFQLGSDDGVFVKDDGKFTVEVGTNVTYASYANKGHHLCAEGVATRFVPGDVVKDAEGKVIEFTYNKNAKDGITLKQRWVEGSHYWDNALRIMEDMLPGLLESKIQQWIQRYFKR